MKTLSPREGITIVPPSKVHLGLIKPYIVLISSLNPGGCGRGYYCNPLLDAYRSKLTCRARRPWGARVKSPGIC